MGRGHPLLVLAVILVVALAPLGSVRAQDEAFWDTVQRRDLVQEYLNKFRTRVLTGCLDFDRSTRSRPSLAFTTYVTNAGDADVFLTSLRRSALNYCKRTRGEYSLDCECVVLAVNNRFRLEASETQLARLRSGRHAQNRRLVDLEWELVAESSRATIFGALNEPQGKVEIHVDGSDLVCSGTYSLENGEGRWSAGCGDGIAAWGTYDVEDGGRVFSGSGQDSDGNRITFAVPE